jgi:Cysteine protease
MPYLACSSDSTQGFCPFVDTTCSPENICRTCSNPSKGGTCKAVSKSIDTSTATFKFSSISIHTFFLLKKIHAFPYATVAEYGSYHNQLIDIMAEIYARGPVTAGIAGAFLHNYTGGIITDRVSPSWRNLPITHEVSIVGWGTDDSTGIQYWIVRNSHGEYWGELSFFRIELGINLLGIESHVSWATPGHWTVHNIPCVADGSNCQEYYIDPSVDALALGSQALSAFSVQSE